MKSTKSFIIYAVIFLSIALLITGCGGGGGGNSVGPEPDPTDFETVTFSAKENEIFSPEVKNTYNIAVDVPADGSNYLVNISSPFNINVKLSSSNANTDARMSMAEEPQPDIGEWIYDPNLMARHMFAEAAKAHQNRVKSKNSALRASTRCSSSDHSHEVVGQEYSIQVGDYKDLDILTSFVSLNHCKLVKETPHAKFFVDQQSWGSYSSQATSMENLINSNGGLAELFENYMYKVLEENYGTVADVDGDKKLSVLITSKLSSWDQNLEGLFTYETMINDPDINPVGISDFRDLILLAPPTTHTNKGCHKITNNLIHEAQHAVNFSMRAFSGNTVNFDKKAFPQELGFDEGCSVAAEALFRRAMGAAGETHSYEYRNGGPSTEYTGNTIKFSSYSISNVFPFDKNNFSYGAHYGRNGLFMLYLYDRFGKEKFKRLIQQGWQGDNLKNTIPEILGCNSISDLQSDWHLALQFESIRPEIGVTKKIDGLSYADWLNLNITSDIINYPLDNVSRQLEGENVKSLKYSFTAPKSSSKDSFRFFIKSADNVSLKNIKFKLVKIANN